MKNETEDRRYIKEMFIPERISNEHKQHMYQQLQRSFGMEVFEMLYKSRIPAVIDFREETILVRDNYEPGERVRYTLTITPVEHRHIEIAHYEPTNTALFLSATEEIKHRISKKIKSVFKKKEKALA